MKAAKAVSHDVQVQSYKEKAAGLVCSHKSEKGGAWGLDLPLHSAKTE